MSWHEIILNALFYVFALTAIGGSIAVALSKNIVRTAFALLTVLFATAAIYALLKADFIAAVQVLIYVGGILVLIIFAIMLTHKIVDVKISNESMPSATAFFITLLVFFTISSALIFRNWKVIQKEATYLTEKIGFALSNEYLLPFEIISVLLLAALIGAAFLARKEIKE